MGGVGCPGHQSPDACTALGVVVVMGVRAPRLWLHLRQMVRPLLTLLVPPYAWGMMWSGSALLGFRLTL